MNGANAIDELGPPTFEGGEQLTDASHYCLVPLFQQMTAVEDEPAAVIHCRVQG